jgi:DNA polymerase I-like protein with 3'-5' exonuclease and polymerase domains
LDPADAEIILTVHDSILLNVSSNKVSYIIKTIKRVLEEEVPFADEIPLTVDFGVGERWGSLVKPEEYNGSDD